MKKLLGILVLGLLATACSERESATNLIENCADYLFNENYSQYENEIYLKDNSGLTNSQFLEMNLKDKLKHKFRGYENRYKKCENEEAKFPKTFKAKYKD